MNNTTSNKIDDAKDHLREAKNDIKSVTQEKTAEKLEQVGDKVQNSMSNLADKISPETKSHQSNSKK